VKTLKLTSPYMRGPEVLRLQKAMAKKGWLKGERDSVYGPLTAQAVHRSKYWLGYATPDQTAAELLLAYLEGKKPLTPEMNRRAAARKQMAQQTPVRQKALNWLTAKVGDKEHPAGSNRVPWASEWYGLIGPWCAMAVTRAYVEAGSKAFVRRRKYAYVPYIVNDGHAGVNNLAVTTEPKPGDLACFDWQKDGTPDHVGLFVKWKNKNQGAFVCCEGNTGIGNDSNGGAVMMRDRSRAQVRAFIHVGR
jgi:hypothetical protein